jgi:quinol monooxygenase YgiN
MTGKLAFYVRFHVRPEKVEEFKSRALHVLESMASESTFVRTHFNQEADDPNRFTLFEVWNEPSFEAFVENQLNAKDYRKEYEALLPDLLGKDGRTFTVLSPLRSWTK